MERALETGPIPHRTGEDHFDRRAETRGNQDYDRGGGRITKYKKKVEESQRKMELTQANLQRLKTWLGKGKADAVSQGRRQMARRYKGCRPGDPAPGTDSQCPMLTWN